MFQLLSLLCPHSPCLTAIDQPRPQRHSCAVNQDLAIASLVCVVHLSVLDVVAPVGNTPALAAGDLRIVDRRNCYRHSYHPRIQSHRTLLELCGK